MSFYHIEIKHILYRRKGCIKMFCSFLSEHVTNIHNFEKKKMLPLIKKELKLHQDSRNCYIYGKRILKKHTKSNPAPSASFDYKRNAKKRPWNTSNV